jgi:hypothetical protein
VKFAVFCVSVAKIPGLDTPGFIEKAAGRLDTGFQANRVSKTGLLTENVHFSWSGSVSTQL